MKYISDRCGLAKTISLLVSVLIFNVACSTMSLKQYPIPSMNLFENSKSINGVSTVVQPLLDDEKGIEYFGVNLLQTGTLAIYLSIKNSNPNVSFTHTLVLKLFKKQAPIQV